MQNESTKNYIHVGALFQNLGLGPKSPLGSPVYVVEKDQCTLIEQSVH